MPQDISMTKRNVNNLFIDMQITQIPSSTSEYDGGCTLKGPVLRGMPEGSMPKGDGVLTSPGNGG